MPSIVSPSVEVNGQAKSPTLLRPSTTDPETDSGKRRNAVSTFEIHLGTGVLGRCTSTESEAFSA